MSNYYGNSNPTGSEAVAATDCPHSLPQADPALMLSRMTSPGSKRVLDAKEEKHDFVVWIKSACFCLDKTAAHLDFAHKFERMEEAS